MCLSILSFEELNYQKENTFLSTLKNPYIIIIGLISLLIIYFKFRKNKQDYHDKGYWENRYSMYEKNMDWYVDYNKMEELFKVHSEIIVKLNKNIKILELGCGNSSLAAEIYNKGYKNITSIDFSETIIRKMKIKYPFINCNKKFIIKS